jgi:SAM-dependent methyltransferase
MKVNYSKVPVDIIKGKNRDIAVFSTEGINIDHTVVKSFGDEWLKFQDFPDATINKIAAEYFDILNETIVNKNSYVMDVGCGTGRWTKYLSKNAGFIEAVDPSDALIAADNLLGTSVENVRLTKASTDNLPFEDETFDFVMSVGVLHHIPDTQKAMQDCVKKVKKGGHFYCYLYYNLDSRGTLFKSLFWLSDLIRKFVSKLPSGIKKMVTDLLAVIIYMPLILFARFLNYIGLKKMAEELPLSSYRNKSFFVIRNDSLDRFGTKLEHRFSKAEVIKMMENAGLSNIVVSPNVPYYHAVGKKI